MAERPFAATLLYELNKRIDDWRDVRRVTDDLLKSPDELDRIGCTCREWYLSYFSPSAQAERIVNLVQMRSFP